MVHEVWKVVCLCVSAVIDLSRVTPSLLCLDCNWTIVGESRRYFPSSSTPFNNNSVSVRLYLMVSCASVNVRFYCRLSPRCSQVHRGNALRVWSCVWGPNRDVHVFEWCQPSCEELHLVQSRLREGKRDACHFIHLEMTCGCAATYLSFRDIRKQYVTTLCGLKHVNKIPLDVCFWNAVTYMNLPLVCSIFAPSQKGEGDTLVLQVSHQDGGAYLCEAQNQGGSQKSAPVSLRVATAAGNRRISLFLLIDIKRLLFMF